MIYYDDLRDPLLWKAFLAEFIGTSILTLIGCEAWIHDQDLKDLEQAQDRNGIPNDTTARIALTFGLAYAVTSVCFGHCSGGHFNPSISFALLCTGRISIVRCLLYLISQCAGAATGAALLASLASTGADGGKLGATVLNPSVTVQQALAVEFIVTFLFTFAYFASSTVSVQAPNQQSLSNEGRSNGGNRPWSVGCVTAVCHLFAINYTRCGLNCARSFGPAVIANVWFNHWVYWLGPLLGALVAGFLFEMVFAGDASLSKLKGFLFGNKAAQENIDEKQSEERSEDLCNDAERVRIEEYLASISREDKISLINYEGVEERS